MRAFAVRSRSVADAAVCWTLPFSVLCGGKCGQPSDRPRRREDAFMHADMPRRRVLVAAGASAVFALRNLFSDPLMMKWEPVEADNVTRARFIMQHHPCEVVLLNDDLFALEGEQALAWLAHGRQVPVIVLAADKGP